MCDAHRASKFWKKNGEEWEERKVATLKPLPVSFDQSVGSDDVAH